MASVKQRALILLGSIIVAVLFLLPTFFRDTFKDAQWISKPISLGLDLSGGVHLLYQVQGDDAIKTRLQSVGNNLKAKLRDQKVPVVRAKATDAGVLEVTVLTDGASEKAKEVIAGEAKDLQFKEKSFEGERAVLKYGLPQVAADKIKVEAVNQSLDTLRNRVDQFGVSEPLVQRVGSDRILLQMPGVSDVASVKKVVGSVAKLEFRLLPAPGKSERTITLKDKQGAAVVVEDEVLLNGDAVSAARVNIEHGKVDVSITFNAEGARAFEKITTDYTGRNLAIILDSVVYSSPVLREPIRGGQASISGGFTLEEGRQLAVVLRAGALPATLTVLEERSVGPTLGAESIKKGVIAIVGGFILVAVFMILYYKKSGMVAVASLVLNLFLILAILSAFGATLTLPGLAALALTIGVAVDSNVIIFERIKDELYTGVGKSSAVRAGFDKAFSAILDANLAAFFTGIILYFLGTGPIKGFAVSLCVGIVTTVFCAVFASRIAFDYFELKGKKFSISI